MVKLKTKTIARIELGITILDRSNHVTKLRIKETLHISKTESQLNIDNQSLPLHLFNA